MQPNDNSTMGQFKKKDESTYVLLAKGVGCLRREESVPLDISNLLITWARKSVKLVDQSNLDTHPGPI